MKDERKYCRNLCIVSTAVFALAFAASGSGLEGLDSEFILIACQWAAYATLRFVGRKPVTFVRLMRHAALYGMVIAVASAAAAYATNGPGYARMYICAISTVAACSLFAFSMWIYRKLVEMFKTR